jgi:maltooligosyltrehalose trehalohydrolase
VLTSPFTPMLFMGEEWGASTPWQFFTSYDNPELAEAVRKGRRAEFAGHGWREDEVPDPQDPATRDRSVLDWSEPENPEHAALLRWYRDLLSLRRTEAGLFADDLRQVRVEFGETWLVVDRSGFSIAVNLGPEPAVLPVPVGSVLELGWGAIGWPDDNGRTPQVRNGGLQLGPDSVAVVRTPALDLSTDTPPVVP